MEHTKDEIIRAEEQLRQAFLHNDLQLFERLLHDDLLFFDMQGKLVTKQEDLASHAAGALIVTSNEPLEQQIRMYGETAIAVVTVRLRGSYQGTPITSLLRYLRVWIFQDSRWQIVAGNLAEVTENSTAV